MTDNVHDLAKGADCISRQAACKKMIESCDNCVRKMSLVKFDYSHGGCVDTDYDGYACLAFAYEGVVVHMVGIDNGMCEMYQPRKEAK